MKLNFVNKDIRYEDFNLGRQYSIEGRDLAASVRRGRGRRRTSASPPATANGSATASSMPAVVAVVAARRRAAQHDRQHVACSTFAAADERRIRRRFSAALSMSSGWRMDAEQQFFADGLTGLRGYRAHAFAGSRAIVLNVEERLYLGREILQLASPGIVAFADAGNATSGGFTNLMHLKSDVGIGLRMGLPRTPKNLLRIDLAYALNRDPLGRKGWLMAFSSGQAF